MDRQAVLTALIEFTLPLAELETRLARCGWDEDPAAALSRAHVVAVLERFAAGELDAAAVETWANLVENREDISFESGHEAALLEAIHDLANPVLQGPPRVAELIALLGGS